MDEMTLLRRHDADVPAPSKELMSGWFDALDQRMTAETLIGRRHASPVRRRGDARRAALLVGAAAAVTAMAAALVTAAPMPASAAAREVLQRAALRAASTSAAEPGSVVEFTTRTLESHDAAGTDATDAAAYRDGVQSIKVPTAGRLWVRKEYFAGTEFAYGDRTQLPDLAAGPTKAHPLFLTSKNGAFVHDETAAVGRGPLYPAWIRALPRDPEALLHALRGAEPGTGAAGSGWQVMNTVGTILRSGAADGKLQAALYTVLQQTPDLTVIDQHANDLTGRSGVLIGVKPNLFNTIGASRSEELLIDPATGSFLGERVIALHADGVVPAGTVLVDRAVTLEGTADPQDWIVPAGSKEYAYN